MKKSSLDKKRMDILHDLEKRIAYSFNDINLLSTALTHRSYVNENPQTTVSDNERFEFLGDSVLSLCVSDLLVKKYVNSPEGDLTKIRASLVNEKNLAQISRDLEIGNCLLIGRGEENADSRDKESFLADSFEAVIAAVYLDSDFNSVRTVITNLIEPLLADDNVSTEYFDYKTELQELCQKRFKTVPIYMVTGSSGPDHDKSFSVKVIIVNKLTEFGSGKSKKDAEKDAAQKAWEALRDEE